MKISIFCNAPNHPVYEKLKTWVQEKKEHHEVSIIHQKSELVGGDILFLVSCTEVIGLVDRQKYRSCLVLHASDLPRGRGWSPAIWEILDGANAVTVSLIEADDIVDSGKVWKKLSASIPKDALWDEINEIIFSFELELMSFAIETYNQIIPQDQAVDVEPTYYGRRYPRDSELSTSLSISAQFNLMRICDPIRYPAFFEMHGQKYKLILEKMND
jgi:methionyl-tRNA formyltransferase